MYSARKVRIFKNVFLQEPPACQELRVPQDLPVQWAHVVSQA